MVGNDHGRHAFWLTSHPRPPCPTGRLRALLSRRRTPMPPGENCRMGESGDWGQLWTPPIAGLCLSEEVTVATDQLLAMQSPIPEREDWETPASVFDPLNEEFGFTLDAAASDHNAKVPTYYTQ